MSHPLVVQLRFSRGEFQRGRGAQDALPLRVVQPDGSPRSIERSDPDVALDDDRVRRYRRRGVRPGTS